MRSKTKALIQLMCTVSTEGNERFFRIRPVSLVERQIKGRSCSVWTVNTVELGYNVIRGT
jgi:hypothetical protein